MLIVVRFLIFSCQRIDPLEGTARLIQEAIQMEPRIGCQRIDPLEGTARFVFYKPQNAILVLPEDRPVGGYCKIGLF